MLLVCLILLHVSTGRKGKCAPCPMTPRDCVRNPRGCVPLGDIAVIKDVESLNAHFYYGIHTSIIVVGIRTNFNKSPKCLKLVGLRTVSKCIAFFGLNVSCRFLFSGFGMSSLIVHPSRSLQAFKKGHCQVLIGTQGCELFVHLHQNPKLKYFAFSGCL